MRTSRALFVLAAAGLVVVASGRPQLGATITAPSTLRYEEVKDWPKLPPGVQMGEAAGVAVDTSGHVFVFHRPGRGFDPAATETLKEAAVLEIDARHGTVDSRVGRQHLSRAARHHHRSGRTTSSSPTWGCIRCSSSRTTAR